MRWVLMLFATVAFVTPVATVDGGPRKDGAAIHRPARLELRDGSSKTVQLDGVGCNESICSRVVVRSRTIGDVIVNRTRFEDLRAVQVIRKDEALFIFKDGSTRRFSVVPDNRVLYVIDAAGTSHKIGLNDIRSIELLDPIP